MYGLPRLVFLEDSKISIQKQPPEVFCKKDVLRNFAKFTGKQSLFLNKVADLRPENFIKKETKVFSCEFCEISKNTFFNITALGDFFYQ